MNLRILESLWHRASWMIEIQISKAWIPHTMCPPWCPLDHVDISLVPKHSLPFHLKILQSVKKFLFVIFKYLEVPNIHKVSIFINAKAKWLKPSYYKLGRFSFSPISPGIFVGPAVVWTLSLWIPVHNECTIQVPLFPEAAVHLSHHVPQGPMAFP